MFGQMLLAGMRAAPRIALWLRRVREGLATGFLFYFFTTGALTFCFKLRQRIPKVPLLAHASQPQTVAA